MDETTKKEIEVILLTLLKATDMPKVKAWAMNVAFMYGLSRSRETNPTEIWKAIENIYESHVKEIFTGQRDAAQSFRRASGDAFEGFVEDYLNSNYYLQREGIRAVRLAGEDFDRFMNSLGLKHPGTGRSLEPKDVDLFLQGMREDGTPRIFGAIFPKVSYAERIRADIPASQALMEKGLFSITITLDARAELGTQERPSVKRRTINEGGFHACYSFNRETKTNGQIYVVNVHEKRLSQNFLIRDILKRWRKTRESGKEQRSFKNL
jgi:hypothetical protein